MNTSLHLDPKVGDICGRAVVITGTARSGTTIMGKILHSFQGVEYAFEPPLFFSLFPLLDKLDSASWTFLYETYLYEDLLINALAGRGLNTSLCDDSSIFLVKPEEEVQARLRGAYRKTDLEILAREVTIAYKCPDVIGFIPGLKRYYPGTRVVVMKREAQAVFHSLRRKGWFTNESLRTRNAIWPNRFVNGLRAPFWVREEDLERWAAMDEQQRIAYYYVTMHEAMEHIEDALIISYRELLTRPREVTDRLCEALGLAFGPMTPAILETVHLVPHERDPIGLDGLEPSLLERVMHYSNQVSS